MKRAWMMLMWLLLTQLAVAFAGRSIGPLAPFFESEFQLSKSEVGLLPAALFVGQSLVSLPAGWLSDRLGTRRMLLFISLALGGALVGVTLVPGYSWVLLFVFLGGLGYGAMHPTSSRGIIHWFPVQLAGTAMGIKQMGVTGGSALAALILLPAAAALGWRAALLTAAALLILFGFFSFLFYREAEEQEKEAERTKHKIGEQLQILLRNRPLLLVSAAAMGLTGAQLSLTTYLVFYVADGLLYSLVLAGVFLALSEIGGSFGRIIWGMVSDRMFRGARLPVLLLIAVGTAACSIVTAFLPPGVSLWILSPVIFLFGFCISGFNGMWMNFAAEAAGRRYAGIASGFSLSIGSWGVVMGPPLFGWMVDRSGGYTGAWLFMAVDMLVVLALVFAAQKRLYSEQEKEASVSKVM